MEINKAEQAVLNIAVQLLAEVRTHLCTADNNEAWSFIYETVYESILCDKEADNDDGDADYEAYEEMDFGEENTSELDFG